MDDLSAQHRRLRALFDVFLTPLITKALLPLARPALRLGAEGAAPVRLGGAPLLPPDEPWPRWNGRPLDFLGAVDFADLAGFGDLPGLPASDRAAFYYASEVPRPWGDEAAHRDGWRVLTGDLRPAAPPPGALAYPETTLHAAKFLSLPSPEEPVVRRLESAHSGVSAVYGHLHAAWTNHIWPDGAPAHQLGGWPVLVQRPIGPDCLYASSDRTWDTPGSPALSPDEERQAEDWRLLLQLDSDDRLGWYWGDPGRVYFCARRNAPLHDTWLSLQAA